MIEILKVNNCYNHLNENIDILLKTHNMKMYFFSLEWVLLLVL